MSEQLKYKRVVLKLSGEALAGEQGFGISPPVVDRMTDEVKDLHERGVTRADDVAARRQASRAWIA